MNIENKRIMPTSRTKTLIHVFLFEIRGYLRNRWLLLYAIVYFLFSSLLMHFGGSRPAQAYASLLNLVLLMIPLFTLLFGGISFQGSLPFMELIISRKISRKQIYFARWLALGTGLSFGCLAGTGLAALLFLTPDSSYSGFITLLFLSIPTHFVFTSLAFLIALMVTGREAMLGALLAIWFYFYILYDLLILGLGYFFGDYPLEIPVLILVVLNPLDLVRIVLLFQVELSSLIGFGGALFSNIFGGASGPVAALFILGIWIAFPLWLGLHYFDKKDF